MEFDRIRTRLKKSKAGSKYEVVKETHKAGSDWNGEPDTVEVIDRGLSLDEAKERVKKLRRF